MKRPYIKIDDSLIISRVQQKELLQIKPTMALDSQFFPLITSSALKPFFDNLPIELGLTLETLGNKLIKAQVDRGYFHHNVEEILAGLNHAQGVFAIGRLHQNAPIFYQIALMLAYEELTHWPTKEKKRYAIALEFARIAHHVRVVKHVLYCLDLTSPSELMETLEQLLMKPFLLFSRVYKTNEAHVVPMEFGDIANRLVDALQTMEEINSAIGLDDRLTKTLSHKGIITLPIAGSMGLTGLYLRANRNFYDLRRKGMGRMIYETTPKISLTEGGDALARFSLRLMEISASLSWLKEVLMLWEQELIALSPIVIDDDYCALAPVKHFALGELEGPEGDIKISIFRSHLTDSYIFRVRTPAYFIAQAIPHLVANLDIRDLAIMLHSLGITAEEVDK